MTTEIQIVGPIDLIPEFAHADDAGCDLKAAKGGVVLAKQRSIVFTGISIALPENWAAFVHPRSGLALKHGITVLNAPGTIDAGYRGEIAVVLYNTTDDDFRYRGGDRIAQLVFQEVKKPTFKHVMSLDSSTRGVGGFGSTGN